MARRGRGLSMKIGELSRFSGVSRDTIRYYVSLGLLSPQQKNRQYSFSNKDLDDLLAIEKFKGWQFTLHEIETVMRIKRTSNWIEPSAVREFTLLMKKKRSELDAKILQMQSSRNMIDQELMSLLSKRETAPYVSTGVPLKALPLLQCPRCGADLSLEQASISGKYVHSGRLTCKCGYEADIENGIIDTGNRYLGAHDRPDLERELYRTLCNDLLRMYQICSCYIRQQLDSLDLSGKIVFEGCVNGYFFLYNHLATLPKDCLYVVVDKYPQMLAMYKDLIEKLCSGHDFLYIADANAEWPFKRHSVDVFLEFFSTTEYELYHENSFIRDSAEYLADEAVTIGSYMELRPNARTRELIRQKYPESSSHAYTFTDLRKDMEEFGFTVESSIAGTVQKTQNRFSFECHVDGEEMKFITFTGYRNNQKS